MVRANRVTGRSFEIRPDPAFWADRDCGIMAKDADLSIDDDKIEVTGKMIEAGISEYTAGDLRFELPEEIVARIYRAMVRASHKSSVGARPLNDL
jgi:hypothetical protein